jgi:GT2 family glycosyltransferase
LNKRIPKVTVVIPHWNGEEILRRCLLSLKKSRYRDFQILVVDNGSTDDSVGMVKAEFPNVRLVESPVNLGFAAGCNLGIRSSESPCVLILNNDTEVDPNWLGPLVQTAESDPRIAAVQPKMLSIYDRRRFDYCGAAGGEIDIFGYPFARGRLFDTMELDEGEYDQKKTIFWSTGAATLFNRSVLKKVGLFDETFFAHMEEIDLNWRIQWAGYRIVFEPASVVYHQTGATLNEQQLKKMVLNHRNNLLMLLRNHTSITLLWLFPIRLFFEMITLGFSLATGQWKRFIAIVIGFFGLLQNWKAVDRGRKQVSKIRTISESELLHRMYRGSVALAYFFSGVRSVRRLKGYPVKIAENG